MQKAAKLTITILIIALVVCSTYFSGIFNQQHLFDKKSFLTYREYVTTGPNAGMGIIRLEYHGTQTLPGNLTVQAEYKDTGETVLAATSEASIEPGWRQEFTVTRPSDIEVVITVTYKGETIAFSV
jgi:hypothetical protein